MKTIKQIDDKTRVVFKWLPSALDRALCLQRKGKRYWKTVSWTYPTIMVEMNRSLDNTIEHLFWDEEENKKEIKGERQALNILLKGYKRDSN